jgi:hypothetical protein
MRTVESLPDDDGLRASRRHVWVRRVCVAALVALVTLGLLGVLGVRTASETATGPDGRSIEVTYPRIARGGLAARFDIEITVPGGFEGFVEVEQSAHYLAMFDENGLDPDADSVTSDGRVVIWTFEPPEDGDTMVVSFDARIEPAVQWGRGGHTLVRFADGEELAVDYYSWILP